MAIRRNGSKAPGPATDVHGQPVIDPTENVLALVEAAVKREDDLRDAFESYNHKLHKSEAQRTRAETQHTREILTLHTTHQKALSRAETERIDAIRQVDVSAVAAARVEAEARATTLANQVSASAEAVRVQVAATAGASATALLGEIGPLKKDIADLRQVQYETAGGKSQQSETREVGSSKALWISLGIAAMVGFSTVTIGIIGVAITLLLRQ